MGLIRTDLAAEGPCAVPRARGTLTLTTKFDDGASRIDKFRTSGSAKAAFPRSENQVEVIMINSSGGFTGGDEFTVEGVAGAGSSLMMTTQSAERVYRSQSGTAHTLNRLTVEPGARLCWLPQELILYDGGALERELHVDVAPASEALIAETILFGRVAMGETVETLSFRDTVSIRRAGKPIWNDRMQMKGRTSERLGRPAMTKGHLAMASVIYVGECAEHFCQLIRPLLPDTGGASLPQDGILNLRILSEDGYQLRQTLVPILQILARSTLPRSWSL